MEDNNNDSSNNDNPSPTLITYTLTTTNLLQSYQSHIYNPILSLLVENPESSLFFLILLQLLSSKLMLRCPSNHFLFLPLVCCPAPQQLAQLLFTKMKLQHNLCNFYSSKRRAQQAPTTILDSPRVKSLAFPWTLGWLVVLPCLLVLGCFHF
jgi:hypothetical protein